MRSTDQTMNAVRHTASTNLRRDKDRPTHEEMIIADTIELLRIIGRGKERNVNYLCVLVKPVNFPVSQVAKAVH